MSNTPKVRRCDTIFDDVVMIPGKLMPRAVPYGFVHDTKTYWSSDYCADILWTLCGEELQGGDWWGCGTAVEVTCPRCIAVGRKGKEKA